MSKKLVNYLRYQVHGETVHPKARRRRPRRGPARSSGYLAWIRTLPSAVSGLYGCEAAHTGSDGGMRQKASDFSCIPLTPAEHREYHRLGRKDFERAAGIDCLEIVQGLLEIWRNH